MLFPLRPNRFSCSIFSIFACCRSCFFIRDSNLSSHPDFDGGLQGSPIFSQTNFAPAYIKSFNSVMLFVGIFVNKSFIFSVLDWTVLQSWFLREGNGIFFLDRFLFMISTFIFHSWVDVCVFVFMVYQSLTFSVWFWFGISVFPLFSVLVMVLGVN